jgi:uncharacterized protein YcfJ
MGRVAEVAYRSLRCGENRAHCPLDSTCGARGSATNHCLTGCVLGEVAGMVIATALGWGDVASIALAVGLAFLFG